MGVPQFEINIETDISEVASQETFDVIRKNILDTLEKEGLYDENLIYRGFSKRLMDRMLKHGTDRNSHDIYGNTE